MAGRRASRPARSRMSRAVRRCGMWGIVAGRLFVSNSTNPPPIDLRARTFTTYAQRMDSRSLTEEQLAKLTAELLRQARYHNRLVERMQQLRFPPNDPLWIYGLRCRDE